MLLMLLRWGLDGDVDRDGGGGVSEEVAQSSACHRHEDGRSRRAALTFE
jgi:hypothetical protein